MAIQRQTNEESFKEKRNDSFVRNAADGEVAGWL